MTPEELKLIEEGGKAFVQAAKDYADLLLKPSLNEVGGILGDYCGQWRLRNQAKMLLKTKRILEEHGIDPSKMLPNIFVPLVEEAGNTEDELLSNMFASLLVGQAGQLDDGSHPAYARILGQLSSGDACICLLLALCVRWLLGVAYKDDFLQFTLPWLSENAHHEYMPSPVIGIDIEMLRLSWPNLLRLNLVQSKNTVRQEGRVARPSMDIHAREQMRIHVWNARDKDELFEMTSFGQGFVIACAAYVDTASFDEALKVKNDKAIGG